MRIDGGSGRSKKPAKKNKKAEALIKDIADAAVSKLGSPAPARRVKNFDKAMAKPRPKARVLENERAKGESKVKTRVVENERAKAAPKLKPRVIENERAKAEPKVDIQNLRTLLDKKQPENRRAKALTQLQRTDDKTYRLPDDSVLKSIATGKPVEKKPTKKPEKKERSLLDKASYLVPGIGPARVIAKGGGKALDAAVPLAGDLIAHTFGDKVRALNQLAAAEYKTGKKLGLISSSPTGSPMPSNAPQTSGFTGTEGVKRAAKKGTLAAGGLAIKGLSAPLAGTESVVGKGLVKAGVINGESAEKIRNAPGPIKAFKKTLKKGITPDQVHGSDITKGLGLGKTSGVLADLSLDPLMWVGAGLAPVTGGASLAVAVARAENRLRVLAPQIFHGEEIQTALRSLRTDGDQAAFLKVVERVAPKEALDAARVELSQAAVKKALDARDARKEQMGVRKRRKLHEVVRGKDGKLVVEDVIPPPVGTDAVAAAMRAGKSRETSSTLGFQFRTPMGRKANINLKIAGKSIIREGNIPLLPLGKLPIYTSKKSYLRSVARERSAKLATIDGDAQAKLREVAVKKAEIQYLGRGTDDDMVKLDELETGIKQDAHLAKQKQGLLAGQEYTPDVPRSLFTSVADRVQARNVQIAQVDSGRVLAADVGRMTGRQFEQLYDKALSPIKSVKDPVLRSQSAKRAQLYREMMTSSDGVLQHMADYLLQLTPEEKLVANNLDATNKMELAHAQDVGLMNHGWEGYAGQRIWYGANDALNPQQQIDKMVGRPIPSSGSTTAAMKQRSAQSLFDVADPDQIAGLLQSLGRVELDPSEYRVLADKLHESGTARTVHELMARRFQRTGTPLLADALTDIERRTLTRDASIAPDQDLPLWRDLDDPSAEGRILPANWDTYGLQEDPYASINDPDQRAAAVLRDVQEDRDMVAARLVADPANSTMRVWLDRIDAEILTLDETNRAAAIHQQLGLIDEGDFSDMLVVASDGGVWVTDPGDLPPTPAPTLVSRDGVEAGPLEDPRSLAARLPDFRSGQPGVGDLRRGSGLVPELHPRVVGHVRSRATGIATANQIRYDAITQAVGRNSDETRGTYYHRDLDEEGPRADLSPIFDQDGKITGYRHNVKSEGENDVIYEADELDFPTPGLVTTNDKAGEYWDPITSARYRHPHQTFGNTLMGQNIKESTLWPVQYIDDLAMSSQRAGEYDQVFDTALQSLNQRVLSTLRFGVTVPFPAYHIRNMASDLVKSLQADSGVLFHPWVNSKLAGAAFGKGLDRTVKVPGFGDMPLPDFLLMADMFGVRTGGQVNDFMEAFSTGAITEQKVAGLIKRTGGRMSELSAEREDVVRYMTFLQRMRRNGGDPAEAAWYMTRHHFNYNDLSHVERRTMRNIFLFYTWFRKNIPLQLIELGRRPGFFAGSFTVYRDLEAGDTPLNVGPFAGPAPFQPGLPDYVRDRMQSFSLPWKDTVVNIGWGAPWSDLGLLSTGDHGEDLFNTVSSMLTPPLSVALQIPTKQEPMTGRTYENDETSGQTAVIDNVMRLFGGEGLMRNEDDKPTLPWPVVVGLRNLPFLGRATASAGATSATRDSGRLQQYGSSLAGLTGLNLFVYPPKGGEREKKLVDSYLKGKVAERRDLLTAIDKLKDSEDSRARKAYVDRLAKLDKELLEDARKRGIGKQLKETDNAGYKSKKKRRKSKSPGGLSGGGLSGGGLSGGGLE